MSTQQHSLRKHSKLAPSKASVWSNCTASVQLVEANADRIVETPSKYAEEGTLAHEVADAKMRGQKAPHQATREMLDHAAGYKRFVEALVGKIDPNGVELEVPLFYLPEDHGHVDFMQLVGTDLHVVDYKYGAGVPVSAETNKQMAVYAMSAIEAFDLRTSVKMVHMHIYQPRCRKEDGAGPASTWSVALDWLDLFCQRDIAIPAQLILEQTNHLLKFAPSDSTCRWCPAAPFCSARAEQLLTGAPLVRKLVESSTVVPPAPETLEEGQLEAILQHADGIIDWLEQIKKHAFNRAMGGRKIAGTKLVLGRGSRRWTSPALAEKLLKSKGIEPFEKSLLSPAKAEEVLKKDKVAMRKLDLLTERIAGAPKLAMASDSKPEYVRLAIEDEFANLEVEDLI